MFELFHAITDPASARVRKYVVDHELLSDLKFRNVTYEEVQRDLTAHGGTAPPALWDGERLITGADAIIARLVAHADVGRAG
jgi:hypothetical protein